MKNPICNKPLVEEKKNKKRSFSQHEASLVFFKLIFYAINLPRMIHFYSFSGNKNSQNFLEDIDSLQTEKKFTTFQYNLC
jgi:hypothetical protein